jgi:hypothetical protein
MCVDKRSFYLDVEEIESLKYKRLVKWGFKALMRPFHCGQTARYNLMKGFTGPS